MGELIPSKFFIPAGGGMIDLRYLEKYYATNIHIIKGRTGLVEEGFNYIRTWDGYDWTKAHTDVLMDKKAQRDIVWHPKQITK